MYNDIASVVFGLSENKDERLPYSLFVINIDIDTDKIHIFASEEQFEYNGQRIHATPYMDWIKKHPHMKEMQRRYTLHNPYVISCEMFKPLQPYDDNFFKDLFCINNMDFLLKQLVDNDCVYILIYKDNMYTDNSLPEMMSAAFEKVIFSWYDFFITNPYNASIPRIDINEIIESLDYFIEVSPYFETVTKISSLFYENARSKGSIAIMRNKSDTPLIQFKMDKEEDFLSFSLEHVKQLRKLLETVKNEILSLLVFEGKVYGIGEPAPLKTLYKFNLTGHMEWHVIDYKKEEKGNQILRYKHGEYYLPTATEIRKWYICSKINDDTVLRTVNHLLKEEHMKAFEHGALLIITESAKREVERLCKLKRGLRTEPISMTTNFDKVCAMCAIDGALFLDKNGECHGIGIILDGVAIVNGTPVRGSRYNSTKTYISRCVVKKIEAYALIMSTDGYLDIITTNDEEFKSIKNKYKKSDIE